MDSRRSGHDVSGSKYLLLSPYTPKTVMSAATLRLQVSHLKLIHMDNMYPSTVHRPPSVMSTATVIIDSKNLLDHLGISDSKNTIGKVQISQWFRKLRKSLRLKTSASGGGVECVIFNTCQNDLHLFDKEVRWASINGEPHKYLVYSDVYDLVSSQHKIEDFIHRCKSAHVRGIKSLDSVTYTGELNLPVFLKSHASGGSDTLYRHHIVGFIINTAIM